MSASRACAYLAGVGLTPFGRTPGPDALDWQAQASLVALDDAEVIRAEVDAVICGYATTVGHLMPANVLAEYLGITPSVAFGMNVGGATGLAMLAQAVALVRAGTVRSVLIAAGEDRASGQSRDSALAVLAQVGHPDYEVPVGGNIPAYYALLASAYLHRCGVEPKIAFAPLAVQMRRNAAHNPGAHFRNELTAEDVLASRMIAEPLRLLDCCPISDGGAAFVVTASPTARSVPIIGLGQAHLHQHVSEANFEDTGARRSAAAAFSDAGISTEDVDIAGVYDSFTVTLAMLLEEIGFVPPGRAGALAERGEFGADGRLPINTHGGLLSYGHCGVGGGMAHVAELVAQLRGEAGEHQVAKPLTRAFVHADGGVLSAHVSAVLGAVGEQR